MRGLILALLLAAGCLSPDGAQADLAVPIDDLGVPADLSAPPADLKVIIDGTNLCGQLRAVADGGAPSNCAVEFFAEFMACFRPAGACRAGNPIDSSSFFCFDDGAKVTYFHTLGTVRTTYTMAGRSCGRHDSAPVPEPMARIGGYGAVDCCGADAGITPAAYYDGKYFTCVDGTTVVELGPNLGDCPELNQLLDAQSQCDGTVIDPTCSP